MLFAELGDRYAVDVLHDEIELAGVADSAVEQTGDVGMGEAGKDLALGAEAVAEEISGEGKIDDLNGDLLVELAVGAVSEVDGTHTAAAQQADESVVTDAVIGDGFAGFCAGCLVGPFCLAGAQEFAQLFHKGCIAAAASHECGGAIRFLEVDGLVEDSFR